MNTPLDNFFETVQTVFWRLPLVGRIALWMLGAWLFAWLPAYLSAGRENEIWLQMLPFYGACGVILYAVRLLMKSQRNRLKKLVKSPAMQRNCRQLNQISQDWMGIRL